MKKSFIAHWANLLNFSPQNYNFFASVSNGWVFKQTSWGCVLFRHTEVFVTNSFSFFDFIRIIEWPFLIYPNRVLLEKWGMSSYTFDFHEAFQQKLEKNNAKFILVCQHLVRNKITLQFSASCFIVIRIFM